MEPIYTPENTTCAYHLNWSVSLFPTTDIPNLSFWFDDLKVVAESDGVRVLSVRSFTVNTIQFFVSTQPQSSPAEIVRSIKGRLQYLIRDRVPKAFQRNYHIQSVGEANANVLDQYVANQTTNHPMADDRVQARLAALQFHDPTIDLSALVLSSHGHYVNSFQIVLENAEGWREVRESHLRKVRDMTAGAARKKGWGLSRIRLSSNHVHILLRASVNESARSIALSLMDNIAYIYEMRPILKFSFYAGTFSGYDRGAIRQYDH